MPEIIQKATEWDKQSAQFKKLRPLDTLHQTHWLQPKYDGCHMLVDTTNMRAFSRTNETVRSCDHIVKRVRDLFGPGWVVQGEAYMQDTPFPFISGKYRQHAPWEPMEFVVYDALPTPRFCAGRYDAPYRERWEATVAPLMYFEPAEGGVYAATLYLGHGLDVQKQANNYVAMGGYDGVILRDPNAIWVAGPSRKGELIKVKPNVSLDLRVSCVDVATGAKTGRAVYTIDVEYRGANTTVGSGMPHKQEDLPRPGQIVEVECMAVNPNNTLREPRYKGIRHDKLEPDE